MSFALNLSQEESEQLQQILAATTGESAPRASLNELLRQWTSFVGAVERGYDDSIYEYTNDLAVRDRLQDLVLASSSTLRGKLDSALRPLDERFALATQRAARPLRADDRDLPHWWRRVPKRRIGELAEDLTTMGYIE